MKRIKERKEFDELQRASRMKGEDESKMVEAVAGRCERGTSLSRICSVGLGGAT